MEHGGRAVGSQKDDPSHDELNVVIGRRIFVGNLTWDTRWQDLKDHFRQCGKVVHADVLSDPTTGRSKGCGLVEFETAKGAAAAVGQFNKVPLRGRPLQVRPDRDDTSQSGVASNGRLFLGNLSWQVEWFQLKDHFAACGYPLKHADILVDSTSGRSKGCAVVSLLRPAQAAAATAAMHDSEFMGRRFTVREDREPHKQYGNGGGVGNNQGVGRSSNLSGSVSGQEGWWAPPTGTVSHVAPAGSSSNVVGLGWGVVTPIDHHDHSASAGPPDIHNTSSVSHGGDSSSSGGKLCYVGNLSLQVSWRELKDHFRARFGDAVNRVNVLKTVSTNLGVSSGIGTVRLATAVDVQRAVSELNGSLLMGQAIVVREDNSFLKATGS